MKLSCVCRFSFALLLAVLTFTVRPSFANPPLFLEENELIMVVGLSDGTPINDAMTVYRLGDQWFIPLTLLMEGLSVPISVSPELGKAEGDFLESSRHFVLDKSQCQAQSGSNLEKYNCDLVVIHNEEIFVEVKLLERWFPIQMKIDTFASEISIESALKFPQQARRERDKLAKSSGQKSQAKPDGFDLFPVPPKNFAGPLLDQQLTVNSDRINGSSHRHDTAVAMELLGFETRSFIGGSEKKVDQWSLNFSKKDPNGQLLGDLQAREVQAFDFSLPSIPLIAGSTRARGLLISSYSLSQASNFTSRDFRGALPSGWEVELYQNDLLVGRQVSETSTEYEFKDLQLVYGVNRFRLVFYGPQGQKREEVETVNIGQNQVQPGNKEYRVALGEKVESTGNLTGDQRSVIQYQQGLTPNWSVATAYASTKSPVLSETTHYGLLGVYGSLSRLFLSLNAAINNNSGSAIEQAIQAPFERGSVGISHTTLQNFKSDLFNSTSNLNLNRVLKFNGAWSFADFYALRLTGEVSQRNFDDHQSTVTTQRTSWKTGPVLWFNTFNHDPDGSPTSSGQLSAVANISGFEIRPLVDYSKKIDAVGTAIQKRISDHTSVELSARDSYLENKREYQGTINRSFPGLALSAEASTDSNGDYKFTGLLSYSLAFEPQSFRSHFSHQAQTDYGAASIFVFLDMDQNGEFNEGDKELEGVQLLVNQNESNELTDSRGRTLLTKLPAYEFVDLSISAKTLSDPLYKPVQKGIRIIPRPGHVFQLALPVIIQSEIDGLVQITSGQNLRGKGQMEVQLKDVSGNIVSAKSSSDGFFLLEKISKGVYELFINPDQLKTMGLKSKPASYQIEVPATGLVESSFDFTLEKESP